MKKYLAVSLLLLSFFISAGTACAASQNPFMDVPAGHWAYDAIGQLAAKGVLSGYPDGVYGGGRPVTRYEMASGLARALAMVDMDKASAEDLEVISRLGVEFQDEFYALNVRISGMEDKVAVLEERLDGWRISGSMLMDVNSWDSHDEEAGLSFSRARLYLDRWFGENGELYFHAAIDEMDGEARWQTFYVDFPVFFDTIMTVGHFERDFENPYNFNTGGVSDLSVGSYMTDREIDGFGLTKRFSLGYFQAFIQRMPMAEFEGLYDAMEATALARLQFNEYFGLDLGFQALWGDGVIWSSPAGWDNPIEPEGYYRYDFNSLYTFFAGLRFDFNDNIGLRGVYYDQSALDADESIYNGAWYQLPFGSSDAYRIVLDVKQELLGFTSLWLGYDFMGAGFYAFSSDGEFLIPTRDVNYDMRTWRIGATQQWNEKWRTWVYFAYHTLAGAYANGDDADGKQWGIGVEYRLSPNVAFALNYVDSSLDVARPEYAEANDHLFRFRTQIDF